MQPVRGCTLIEQAVACSVLYFIGACVLREALALAMKWGRGGDVLLHLAALTCFPAVPLSDSLELHEHGPSFIRFASALIAVLKVCCLRNRKRHRCETHCACRYTQLVYARLTHRRAITGIMTTSGLSLPRLTILPQSKMQPPPMGLRISQMCMACRAS